MRQLESKYTFADIIGESPVIKQAVQLAKVAAATPATVLLLGEGAPGKNYLPMHSSCQLASGQAVYSRKLQCFSESLLESELFGYSEGAFTGARKQGKGILRKRTVAQFF